VAPDTPLYTSLIGVILMQYSSKRGYEPQVMTVFGLIELMLLLMMIVKNPFAFVWDSFPGEVQAGFTPANGRGLNPLLQNYWMVIHPQVLFSGFAAMGVPYAYAVAALMKRDYTNWIRPATPWLVYGALVLGTGIMMGGFWAYGISARRRQPKAHYFSFPGVFTSPELSRATTSIIGRLGCLEGEHLKHFGR
jgi:cytochrome c biogenesis factor